MIVPDEALPYVLLQRTWIKRMAGIAYGWDCRSDYEAIVSALPASCTALLDIGCGLAGIDLFLYRHYSASPHLYLLDHDRNDAPVWYGYTDAPAAYSSMNVTRSLLEVNGVPPDAIKMLWAANDYYGLLIDGQVDLVVSFLAWGYHFPIATYLDQVCKVLAPGGRVIVDVREGTGGLDALRARFDCEVLRTDGKRITVLGMNDGTA